MKADQKGFGHLLVIISILAVAVIGFAGWKLYVIRRGQEAAKNTKPLAVDFDSCVADGGYPYHINKSADPRFMMSAFECRSDAAKKTFYSQFDTCSGDKCSDLYAAFVDFCNNEYKGMRAGDVTGPFYMEYVEPAILKENYARDAIYCYKDGDNQPESAKITVFYKEVDGAWEHVFTLKSSMLCTDMDGLGIPIAISGYCNDASTGKQRAPRL